MTVKDSIIDPENCNIAFIDEGGSDDSHDLMIPYWEAEIAGFPSARLPEKLQDTFKTMDALVKEIASQAQAAICTHRLGTLGGKPLYGAELVATLYDLKIPALLVTQYSDIDKHTSIRKWKDKVPVVLHPREFSSEDVQQYLEECAMEIQGHPPEHRVPYRVLLYVHNVEGTGEDTVVDVQVGRWDHYQLVRLPLSLIPERFHANTKRGTWFFAHVNIKAKYQEDLYFREFELTTEPEDGGDEILVYCEEVHPHQEELSTSTTS